MAELFAWLTRAGRNGAFEQLALDDGLVAIGWGVLGDLTGLDRPELTQHIQATYPDYGIGVLRNSTGQLWAFVNRIQIGDLVALPSKSRPMVAIGRVTGDYQYRADLPEGAQHTRAVKWIAKDVPRTAIGQDLLYSLGSLLTVCRLARNDAAVRLDRLATDGVDPGQQVTDERGVDATVSDSDVSADSYGIEDALSAPTQRDLERDARDAINRRIAERFPAHGLSRLVEAILRAQGMTTFVAPDGKDGGIDVLAGSGPLGMDSPRICVQVKFTKDASSAMVVRELEGVMGRIRADQALLVSWSGVTRDAELEMRREFFRVRVWDADELFRQLTAVYDKLPEEIQAELPLKRIWTIAGGE